jgi:hypothetical protein
MWVFRGRSLTLAARTEAPARADSGGGFGTWRNNFDRLNAGSVGRFYLATSPGTPSRISKEAFVETGAPGVVT